MLENKNEYLLCAVLLLLSTCLVCRTKRTSNKFGHQIIGITANNAAGAIVSEKNYDLETKQPVKNQLKSKQRMDNYYVNKNAQSNGDHEVHKQSCAHLPNPENRLFLGTFNNCAAAVRESKKKYAKTNGCYFCSRPCHTS